MYDNCSPLHLCALALTDLFCESLIVYALPSFRHNKKKTGMLQLERQKKHDDTQKIPKHCGQRETNHKCQLKQPLNQSCGEMLEETKQCSGSEADVSADG